MMKKALITSMLVFIAVSSYAFSMKNPTNRFDVSLADSQSLTPGIEMQGLFNMNESFYVGIRFTTGTSVYYYSATTDVSYLLSFSNIALVLGLQTGAFNERFTTYMNLMPGFGFGNRKTGTQPIVSIFHTEITAVTNTEDVGFFAPAFEFGFNCQLTDNLVLSTGWMTTLVGISDATWATWTQYMWFIKLGETDALLFSIPVRLSWRF